MILYDSDIAMTISIIVANYTYHLYNVIIYIYNMCIYNIYMYVYIYSFIYLPLMVTSFYSYVVSNRFSAPSFDEGSHGAV